MAHFAKLDENNIVTGVIVVDNDQFDTEESGILYCQRLLGGTWKQTSYNTVAGVHQFGGTPFRKNYAGIGFMYDEQRDAFIPPKPFDSWSLNEQTCLWEPPTPMPIDEKYYEWNEETLSWQEIL